MFRMFIRASDEEKMGHFSQNRLHLAFYSDRNNEGSKPLLPWKRIKKNTCVTFLGGKSASYVRVCTYKYNGQP